MELAAGRRTETSCSRVRVLQPAALTPFTWHAVQDEAPQLVNPLILNFVRRHSRPAAADAL